MEITKDILIEGNLIKGSKVKVFYRGKFTVEYSNEVFIVYGFGLGWKHIKEQKMTWVGNSFCAEIELVSSDTLNFCFKNNFGSWDNNYGRDYSAQIKEKEIQVTNVSDEFQTAGFVSKVPEKIQEIKQETKQEIKYDSKTEIKEEKINHIEPRRELKKEKKEQKKFSKKDKKNKKNRYQKKLDSKLKQERTKERHNVIEQKRVPFFVDSEESLYEVTYNPQKEEVDLNLKALLESGKTKKVLDKVEKKNESKIESKKVQAKRAEVKKSEPKRIKNNRKTQRVRTDKKDNIVSKVNKKTNRVVKKEKGKEKSNKKKIIKRIIRLGFLLVFIGCIVYFVINYIESQNVKNDAKNLLEISTENLKPEEIVDNEMLNKVKALNLQYPDLKGWLEIKDTEISYPVMQGTDNDYYITHTYEKEYSKWGSLFLDKAYDWNKPSSNLLIYGHNFSDGYMFADLLNYRDKDFYENHKTIRFITPVEDAEYEIISIFNSRVYYKHETDVFRYYFFVDAGSRVEYNDFVKNAKKASIYDIDATAEYGDQLITLSTCDYTQEDGRFVVVARKIIKKEQ